MNLVVSLVIGTVIIVGEEIGWRGFRLPRFQQLTSKRRAAVITGFAHGCFHLPLILLATTYDTGGSHWRATNRPRPIGRPARMRGLGHVGRKKFSRFHLGIRIRGQTTLQVRWKGVPIG
jgi:hypothetical protein